MRIKQFHPEMILEHTLVHALCDTQEWCEQRKKEAVQIQAAAEEKASSIIHEAREKAQRIKKRTQIFKAESNAECEQLRNQVIADTSKDRSKELVKEIAKIEAEVANIVLQSMQHLFDHTAKASLIASSVRRAIKDHSSFTEFVIRLHPAERDEIEKLLVKSDKTKLVSDTEIERGEALLVLPDGTLDMSPKRQLDKLAESFLNSSEVSDDTTSH